MQISELIEKLNDLGKNNLPKGDPEVNHANADELLLEYINNPEVTKAFESIEKWYS